MTGGKWLTPNEGGDTFLCRPVFIPIDDELYFMAAVNGALLELTHVWNWEDFGTMSAQEAADMMFEMYQLYAVGTCDSDCVCTIPPAYDIDVGVELRIIRRGEDGFTEELVDGEWVTPTGDYEVPTPDTRTESTSDERKCLAAANAATVLEDTYEEATDAYQSFATPAAVANAILDVIVLALGAFGQVTAASYISFGQTVFETFYDYFSLITGDVWTSDFTDELVCILIANATDTAGVITFDYNGIVADILVLEGEAGGDIERHLLLLQLRYLLNIVAAGGINFAGGLTAVSSYDCAPCYPWTIEWNFMTGANGSVGVAYSGCTSTRNASGWGACSNGSVWSANVRRDIASPSSSTHITRVRIEWQPWATNCDERATSFVRVFHSGGSFDVGLNNNPAINTVQANEVTAIDVHTVNRFELVWNGTGNTGLYFRKITIDGYGPMPA